MNMKTLRATLRALDPAYRINPTPDALTVDVLGKTVLIGSGYSLAHMTKDDLKKRIERAGKWVD